MSAKPLAVVCAWCNRMVADAPADADVSHTICPSCLDWTIAHPSSLAGTDASASRLAIGFFDDER